MSRRLCLIKEIEINQLPACAEEERRLLLSPQYQVFFEFNDRMEAVMKKAYIYR